MRRVIILLMALAIAAVPASQALAHGTPTTAEYEEWLVGDFGTDLTLYAPTGYEIDNVIYREAYFADLGGPGIIIRLDAYGGTEFFDGEAFFLYEFDTPGGTVTMSMSTVDDETLSGDGVVLDAEFEPYGILGNAAIMESTVFFSFDQLGLEAGDELAGMRFATAWDIGFGQWRFDVVPGGTAIVPAPAPADAPIIPEGGDTTPIPARTVHGGSQHLSVDAVGQAFVVTNKLTMTTQVVNVRIGVVPGPTWYDQTITLGPGQSRTFHAAVWDENMLAEVSSNIGGHDSLYIANG